MQRRHRGAEPGACTIRYYLSTVFFRRKSKIFLSLQTCSAQCHPLRTSDYNHLLWTTLAEFPGILVSLLLIEKIGRKKTMALEFFLFTVTICLLLHCSASKAVTTAILFLARALGSGLFQTAYVYTPEVRLRDKSSLKHRHLINI